MHAVRVAMLLMCAAAAVVAAAAVAAAAAATATAVVLWYLQHAVSRLGVGGSKACWPGQVPTYL